VEESQDDRRSHRRALPAEINCGFETFVDAVIRLWISDQMNDRRVQTLLSREHFAESGQWLIDSARRLFPEAFEGRFSKQSRAHTPTA
jgi:hypothetical protein